MSIRINELYMGDRPLKKPSKKEPDGSNKPDGDFDWSKVIKTVFSWGAVIIAAVIVMQFMRSGESGATEITYDIYETLLNENKIIEAKIIKSDVNDYTFEGTLAEQESLLIEGKYKRVTNFSVTIVEPLIQEQVQL